MAVALALALLGGWDLRSRATWGEWGEEEEEEEEGPGKWLAGGLVGAWSSGGRSSFLPPLSFPAPLEITILQRNLNRAGASCPAPVAPPRPTAPPRGTPPRRRRLPFGFCFGGLSPVPLASPLTARRSVSNHTLAGSQ